MNQIEATSYIVDHLKSKNVKTVKGEIKYLKVLVKHEDKEVARQANHMLGYAEASLFQNEFHEFLRSEWTQVSGKSPHQLSRKEVKEAQINFERLYKK